MQGDSDYEFELKVKPLKDRIKELEAQGAWYNKRVAVLDEIYTRLGEHCAQGKLDSDVWYKITRLRQDG